MSVREYLGVVWRRKLLIALIVFASGAAVWMVGQPSEQGDMTYSGSATLGLTERERQADGSILLYSYVASETAQITQQVAAELGPNYFEDSDLTTFEVLEQAVFVTPIPDIGTVTFDVIGLSSEQAVRDVLTAYTTTMSDYALNRRTAEINQRIEALDLREATLLAAIDRDEARLRLETNLQPEEDRVLGLPVNRVLDAQLATALTSLTLVLAEADGLRSLSLDERTPIGLVGETLSADPIAGTALGLGGRMSLALFLGLVLGVGLAFALHRFDTKIYNRRDAEAAFRLPVLAEIPKIPRRHRRMDEIVTVTNGGSPASEAYRVLRSAISLHKERLWSARDLDESRGNVVLLASPVGETGRTTTAVNLAAAAVAAGRQVLLVNADLRQPALQRFFQITGGTGLTHAVEAAVRNGGELDELDPYVFRTGIPGLSVMLHGEVVPNPGETLSGVGPVLDLARDEYDVVFVDSPAMLIGNDVNELVAHCDLLLAVVRAGKTTIDEGNWFDETVQRSGYPACGSVLVGSTSPLSRSRTMRRSQRRLQDSGRFALPSFISDRLGGSEAAPLPAAASSTTAATIESLQSQEAFDALDALNEEAAGEEWLADDLFDDEASDEELFDDEVEDEAILDAVVIDDGDHDEDDDAAEIIEIIDESSDTSDVGDDTIEDDEEGPEGSSTRRPSVSKSISA